MAKLNFSPEILEQFYKSDQDTFGEMAVPSYLHPNPLIRWLVAKRMQTIIARMNLKQGSSLVDFGCGTGVLLLQFPPDVLTYYGVDLLTQPAKKVLTAHGRTDFVLLEAANWTSRIKENSIDCIAAIEVLEHVPDVSKLLNQFLEVLKPNGKLIVSGPTESKFYQLARRIAGFSGEYHHRNIYHIMNDIDAAGFRSQGKLVELPFTGPFALFIIAEYSPA